MVRSSNQCSGIFMKKKHRTGTIFFPQLNFPNPNLTGTLTTFSEMYSQATDLLAKVVLWSIGMNVNIVKTGCHHFFLRNAWKGFNIFCIPYMYTVSKLCLLHGLDKDQRFNGKWSNVANFDKFWPIILSLPIILFSEMLENDLMPWYITFKATQLCHFMWLIN